MKPTLAILLFSVACLAGTMDWFERSTTNGVAFVAATRAHYELVPTSVPLPTGGAQQVFVMKRMLSRDMAYTNRAFVLSLRCTPPYNVEVSTNLVAWEFYDQSTNTVYNLEVCAEQQVAFPVAFFRANPMPRLTRIMKGY